MSKNYPHVDNINSDPCSSSEKMIIVQKKGVPTRLGLKKMFLTQ